MKKIVEYEAAKNQGILLNANENTDNFNTAIMQEIIDAIPAIAFNRYPDNSMEELLTAYGKVIGLPKEQILAGDGSDAMLGMLIGTFLGKGKYLYTLDPDFSMYDYYASSYEAGVKKFEIEKNGTFNCSEFIQSAKDEKADMILFSNPNNPTGNCLPIDQIEEIIKGCSDIPVVIDEAYMEFSEEKSAVSLIDQYPNLYVTRTLSKAYGAAGIRVGFMLSNIENMAKMKASAVPYALNSVSMKIGTIVLSHAEEVKQHVADVKKERDGFYEKIKDFKTMTFFPSQANFIFGTSAKKEDIIQALEKENIVIRTYKGTDDFRITIGSKEENQKVWDVLKTFEEANV